MGFDTAQLELDLLLFASVPKFKTWDMPRCTSKPSLMSINKDVHLYHAAGTMYSAHLLVCQVVTRLSRLSADPSQVKGLSGMLSDTFTDLQGALVAWIPLLLESFDKQSYLRWYQRRICSSLFDAHTWEDLQAADPFSPQVE